MIPDFEKRNERMEQASLNELVPDFDKEQEWQKLSGKLHPQKKRIAVWSYAAAIMLLLAVGGWFTFSMLRAPEPQITVHQASPAKPDIAEHIVVAADTSSSVSHVAVQSDKEGNGTINNNDKNAVAIKKRKPAHNTYSIGNRITKDVICNGTPCPLQICINQTMRCPNIEPSSISSCSTLEPDQSGQLNYKAHDKIAKNCSLTIHEIEIKSIATGETILLTENSTPSSAQEVFSYITGQRKGDVLAGMFNSDCNHKTQKHNLTLDNSYGNIIIQ